MRYYFVPSASVLLKFDRCRFVWRTAAVALFLQYSLVTLGRCTIPRRVFSLDEEIAEDHQEFQKALGKRLQKLRKDRGFSTRDMDVCFGYAESQWKRFEREGVRSTQSLLRIAKVFQTTVADLLNGLGQYPKVNVKRAGKPTFSKPLKVAASQGKETSTPDEPRIASWAENSSVLKDGAEEPKSHVSDVVTKKHRLAD